MIRTDSNTQTIIKFLCDPNEPSSQSPNNSQILSTSFNTKQQSKNKESTKLTSIKTLINDFETNCDEDLKEQLRKLTFVGNADRSKSIIQCENILYICDNHRLAQELFYQESLRKFENFDALIFEDELKIHKLARIGFDLKECEWTTEDGCKDELSLQVEKILMENREMLKEYFQISINENGELEGLPLIIENYSPLMAHLPIFLIRMATEVNYESEKECFQGICKELSKFYSRWSYVTDDKDYNHLMRIIIFPKIQKILFPPREFASNGTFLKLTSLQDLYKVFERC